MSCQTVLKQIWKCDDFHIKCLCLSFFLGSASRRCMLDNNGVAFWGPPSFARCVSLEYRYLHLSVSSLLRNMYSQSSGTLSTNDTFHHLQQEENRCVYWSKLHRLSLFLAPPLYHNSPLVNLRGMVKSVFQSWSFPNFCYFFTYHALNSPQLSLKKFTENRGVSLLMACRYL